MDWISWWELCKLGRPSCRRLRQLGRARHSRAHFRSGSVENAAERFVCSRSAYFCFIWSNIRLCVLWRWRHGSDKEPQRLTLVIGRMTSAGPSKLFTTANAISGRLASLNITRPRALDLTLLDVQWTWWSMRFDAVLSEIIHLLIINIDAWSILLSVSLLKLVCVDGWLLCINSTAIDSSAIQLSRIEWLCIY